MTSYAHKLKDSNVPGEVDNPCKFWLDKKSTTSTHAQNHVANQALDCSNSPASEDYCERIFSQCGDLSADKYKSLKVKNV